jgi:hypothetical protein
VKRKITFRVDLVCSESTGFGTKGQSEDEFCEGETTTSGYCIQIGTTE